jgi:hypothetical protein
MSRFEEFLKAESDYYSHGGVDLPPKYTKEQFDKAVAAGMLLKKDLIDGGYYLGWCRNAIVAKWIGVPGCFVHWRTVFNDTFTEEINHPEDDDGSDIFMPLKQINPTKEELISY